MRILFPTLTRFPSWEAPAVQVANMAQAFAELGHDVTVVATAPDPALAQHHPEAALDPARLLGFAPAFRTVVLSQRVHRGQSYLHALRIARMVRHERPDLVFSRNLRACLLPARRGVATVFEAHTLDSVLGRQDRWVLTRLLATSGFRGIVAISDALTQDLARELGIPAERILVAHDAVRVVASDELAECSPAHPDELSLPRSRASTEGTAPVLRAGYTGSLFPGKGVETIVAAAARCPWVEFHVVGGPQELADRLAGDAPDNVVVHGLCTPAQARALQPRFDVLLAPFSRRVESDSGVDISRWTSPMKLFEYLASGRPVIVSDLPVLREVVRADVDALMVAPDDADALIAALVRLRDEPGLGARLAEAAGGRVRAEHTWAVRAGSVLDRFGAPLGAG
jgi:glycosyltransferase involved in cell wall biosynthesis